MFMDVERAVNFQRKFREPVIQPLMKHVQRLKCQREIAFIGTFGIHQRSLSYSFN